MTDILDRFQSALDESEPGLLAYMQQAGASCRPGCSFCCYQLTPVLWIEALTLARAVRGLSPERQREIRTTCSEQVKLFERITTNPHDRWQKLLQACPLLEDGRCSVYHARPLACRGHAVVSDPASCDLSVQAYVVHIPGMLLPMMEPATIAYRQKELQSFEAPLAIMLHYALMGSEAFRRANGQDTLTRASRKWRKHGRHDNDALTRALAGQYTAFGV